MQWSQDLTGETLDIVSSQSKRIRVMAGPGTGKSFAMIRRISRLIEEGTLPEKILAITFTRNAANELKSVIINSGIHGSEKIQSMTLHSFCFWLLNQNNVFNNINRNTRTIKTFTSKGSPQFELSPLLSDLDLHQNFGTKREKFKMLKAFEAAWARNQNEDAYLISQKDKDFHHTIIEWLKDHKSMLVGELVPLALSYLENNPACAIFDKYEYIFVDEYQDLNKAEQLLIDFLCTKNDIFIVGDVDQSIYSFRHAHPEGISDFSARHQTTTDKTLTECRRCGKNIVELANTLITNNHIDSNIRLNFSTFAPSSNINIIQWDTIQEEAKGIANFVGHLVKNGFYQPQDILILSPRRLLGYQIRDQISNNKIEIHSFFHEEAIEDDEAQKAVTLLTLLANKNDCVSLRYWLGMGSTDWRSKQYKIIFDLAIQENKTIPELLSECLDGNRDIKNIFEIKNAYSNLLKSINQFNGLDLSQSIDLLFPPNNLNTEILREEALLFLSANPLADNTKLSNHINLILSQPEMPPEGNYVRIMSLHKSKGLSSKVTIITSCIQGLIPTFDKKLDKIESERMLKEQRRLFYVGITRARELLIFSSFQKIDTKTAFKIGALVNSKNRKVAHTIASQFLQELGKTKPAAKSGKDWQTQNFV